MRLLGFARAAARITGAAGYYQYEIVSQLPDAGVMAWLRRLGRLLRRWWWVYPAWLLLKWGTIFAVGYFAWDGWFTR